MTFLPVVYASHSFRERKLPHELGMYVCVSQQIGMYVCVCVWRDPRSHYLCSRYIKYIWDGTIEKSYCAQMKESNVGV